MNVVGATLEIIVVPDRVLPKPPLPKRVLTTLIAHDHNT